MLNEKVDVEVYGRRFTVEFEGITPIEIPSLAKELTQKLEQVGKESGIVDTSKLAVLVALQYLVEIKRLKAQQENDRLAEERTLERMVVSLQNTLASVKEPARK